MEQLEARLVARAPASPPHRELIALALLRQGRPAEALEVYKDIDVPQQALSASARVVMRPVLIVSSRTDDAKS